MKKELVLTLTCLWLCVGAMAQVVLSPLPYNTQAAQPSVQSINASKRLAQEPLPLPFFDDFATVTSSSPDPARWVNSGVYINNRFAVKPVTRNVATFDGLNANGAPYAPNSVGRGPADTLTSQPITLGGLAPSDSVYLSFYWQSGGLGDVPDRTTDNTAFLQLQFKDASGNWVPVWTQPGVGNVTEFAQVIVPVQDARFFHNDFQFRFRSEGERSGMLDVWNLDYVELDRNRRKGQNTNRDIAISQTITPLLKSYTAMPYRQFLQDPAANLREEVLTTVNNLGTLPGAINWRGFIKKSGAPADTFLRDQGLVPALAQQFEIKGNTRVTNLNLTQEAFVLEHGLVLDTREPNALQRANDSTIRKTEFSDYFAYDDGTAEQSLSFPASGNSQLAQRFDLNLPDQIRAFRVHFLRLRNDLSNTSLTFRIWEDNNGVPGRILHEQSFKIQYTEWRNTFYEVELTKPVFVNGSFYIGWSQPGSLYANVGFDLNENAAGKLYLWTTLNGWRQDSSAKGAVMMRPVMTGEALAADEELNTEQVQVYPNPSAGDLYISGTYKKLSLYDVTGRVVLTQSYTGINEPVSLHHLARGLYTLRIETRTTVLTKKIILNKL
ncbi:T9SS type A sorting domain-containing protein [Pontibacter ruber]|uniref:T9SS type A sorting domain-containing protein n=1 Tax=Pontibacter ruber TaxID=1343895 RepID=A0ABW5CUV4_9BACT|nr:T9SS type A sorting domain-containing protein [Pontibacter ruber]